MKANLWVVIVVVATWLGFLVGYAVSSHSGPQQRVIAPEEAGPQAGAGGYGR